MEEPSDQSYLVKNLLSQSKQNVEDAVMVHFSKHLLQCTGIVWQAVTL